MRSLRLGSVALPLLAACSSGISPSSEALVTSTTRAATLVVGEGTGGEAREMPVTYEVRDGKALFEGDIALPELDEKAAGSVAAQSVGAGNASRRFSLGSL